MHVYLDDERPTPTYWTRVYWPDEAIKLLKTRTVQEISLDHDLGDDKRGTGYDVVLWLEEAVITRNFKPPIIHVHSANTSARIKMESGITNILKYAKGSSKMSDIILCDLGIKDGIMEYLYEFQWSCQWYWSGGAIGSTSFNRHNFCDLGSDTNMYEAFNNYYDHTKLTELQVWRLCDLMKQFYSHTESADCFKHGGNYTSVGRNENELNLDLYTTLNNQLKDVVIPEIRLLLNDVGEQEVRKIFHNK